MIGTNDVYFADASLANSSQEQAYHDTLMAAVTLWLTPPANKLIPNNNPACSGAGWSTDGSFPGAANGYGVYTTTAGAPFSCTYTSYGAPIFVWHLVDTSTGTASVKIDGTTCGTYSNTFPNYAGSHNGVFNTISALRCPVAAGTHTVTITLTAGAHVGFEGIGTPSSTPLAISAPPTMFAFGTLHQNNDSSSAATLFYAKVFENLAAQLSRQTATRSAF